jgi:hypothetical protein
MSAAVCNGSGKRDGTGVVLAPLVTGPCTAERSEIVALSGLLQEARSQLALLSSSSSSFGSGGGGSSYSWWPAGGGGGAAVGVVGWGARWKGGLGKRIGGAVKGTAVVIGKGGGAVQQFGNTNSDVLKKIGVGLGVGVFAAVLAPGSGVINAMRAGAKGVWA